MKKATHLSLVDTVNIIKGNRRFERLLERVGDGGGSVSVGTAARPYLLTALYEGLQRPMLVIVSSFDRARRMASDLKAFGVDVEVLPDIETMPYDSLSPGAASVGKRFAVLDEMQSGLNKVWVSPIQSVIRTIPAPAEDLHVSLKLSVGQEIELHVLAERLVSKGYARHALVEDHGQFSLRGGIVDVFPSNADTPVRIEFFGDEIESIRSFSASTQRSLGLLKSVSLYGCHQMALTEDSVARAMSFMTKEQPEWIEGEIGSLKDLRYFEGIDKYLPFLYPGASTVLDYVPENTILVFDEPEEAFSLADAYFEQQEIYVEHLVKHNSIIKPPKPYFADPELLRENGFTRIDLSSLGGSSTTGAAFKASPIQHLGGKINELPRILREHTGKGMAVIVALSDRAQLERVRELLDKNGIESSVDSFSGETRSKQAAGRSANRHAVALVTGALNGGFESKDIGMALIASSDIFARQAPKRKNKTASKGNAVSSLSELAVGDYVVHSNHGISVYAGLQQREVAGVVRDYALLEYAGTDRLFVPVDQLDRITKYIGAAGETPPISRLGSADWLKAKRKARASVKKVAFDLLSLYVQRAKSKGFAFSADTPWQAELEEAFPYEETPDQLIAIEDVKRDMEREKPMDRLICGDVGYGKTEVAVRAAFKAVADGKQAMVLVPTTILAQQHYKTFSERLSPFPVTVEMVSRFKTPRQQKDILERFSKGSVDVLVGTHRLLAKDVCPSDLGLVVIDEEQRFGVNDKDKLRNFKNSVDVLTLSATPIPRTLQMSIAGVRDMSTIETPPEGRHPIVTHVGRHDEDMMVEAIRREIGRGGQIYYVHNRVETIDRVAERIKKLVPEARIVAAHGQMGEHVLERIMLAFLDKQYDVLVCTTIIESGIDIPTVNTLIVDRAELLGLAQLYQLRGRVGRTSRRAYAYFFYSPQRVVTAQAFERLKTIGEYTDLGSGIKIALRDLEIRGVGSLLGAEQHGNMSSVGFELYCQMLKEAIEEIETGPTIDPIEIRIDLPIDAYVPESYIAEESLRIEAYKKIVTARDGAGLAQTQVEFEDRFGTIPVQVRRLLGIAGVRQQARALGITEITYQNGRVKLFPIRLNKQQSLVLAKSYQNIIVRYDRQYLVLTRLEKDKIVPFLGALFDDIISAPFKEAMSGQKAR